MYVLHPTDYTQDPLMRVYPALHAVHITLVRDYLMQQEEQPVSQATHSLVIVSKYMEGLQ